MTMLHISCKLHTFSILAESNNFFHLPENSVHKPSIEFLRSLNILEHPWIILDHLVVLAVVVVAVRHVQYLKIQRNLWVMH